MILIVGYVVHHEDVGVWSKWLKFASPQWWMGHPIHQGELNPVSDFRYFILFLVKKICQIALFNNISAMSAANCNTVFESEVI